jgi:nitroreductase
MKKIYNKYLAFCDKLLPRYFAKNRFLSSVYYFFFSNKFKREQYAVLNGKVKHLRESKSEKNNFYTLIRNIHRIEKGLLMRPRRKIFGLFFIKETVDNFSKLYSKDYIKDSQLKWAQDVLNEYFLVTGSHPIINKQREIFNKLILQPKGTDKLSIPYKRIPTEKPNISYEEFFRLTKYRRSVRWFLDKKVPHDLIDKAILAANQSPTACNRQPYEFRVIDAPELLNDVRSIPMGLKGYDHNVPIMIVIVGNLDAYFDERDKHVMYIDASLANMSLIFALETLGLSSCCVNWPDIEELEIKMDKALKLKKYQRPIMCLAVGYPDPEGMVAYSEKRNLEQIRKYN